MTKKKEDETSAPDGGWGWCVVLASFTIHVLADGPMYSFGLLYVDMLEDYGSSKGVTSGVASLTVGVCFTVGPVSSVLVDRFGCRVTALVGTACCSLGFFVSAWSPGVYWLYFSYGILSVCRESAFFSTSSADYMHMFVLQTVESTLQTMLSLGFGLLFHPAIVAVGMYFDRRRSLATGISICGSGVGTFLFPPLVRLLVHLYSWRGASIVLGGMLLNCAVCAAMFRPIILKFGQKSLESSEASKSHSSKRNCQKDVEMEEIRREKTSGSGEQEIELLPDATSYDKSKYSNKQMHLPDTTESEKHMLQLDPNASRNEDKNVEISGKGRKTKESRTLLASLKRKATLLKDPSFLLFCVSGTLTSVGYQAPFLFLPHHAQIHGVQADRASLLISVIGICSICGRVIFGYVGDRLGRWRLLAFTAATILNGLSTALCPLCRDYTSLAVYAGVYGFTMGWYMAFNWVLLIDLVGLENYSSSLGLVLMFDGLSTPIGPPLLGWVFDLTGTYDTSFIIGGVIILLSGVVILPIPCFNRGYFTEPVTDVGLNEITDLKSENTSKRKRLDSEHETGL